MSFRLDWVHAASAVLIICAGAMLLPTAHAQPSTMVGQGYYQAAKTSSSFWKGLLGGYKSKLTNMAIEARVRQIQRELSAHGIREGGALYEIEVFEVEGTVWVESSFLAFGPTAADAYRNSRERPAWRAPPKALPHSTWGRQFAYATQVGSQIHVEVIQPVVSAVIRGQVLRQLAAQQQLMREAAAARAQGDGNTRPPRDSARPNDRPSPGGGTGSSGSGGGQSGNGGGAANGGQGTDNRDRGIPGIGPRPFVLMDPPELGVLDGRSWADFNGDGFDDFCRVRSNAVPTQMLVTLSTGPDFEDRAAGELITSPNLDPGYGSGRAWVDFNRDGKADYVRVVGTRAFGYRLLVTYSAGNAFGQSLPMSAPIDPGQEGSRVWVDWDNDGYVDFVRVIGTRNHDHAGLAVTFGKADGFGDTITTRERPFDWGYPESQLWVDMNGDGKPDFVRVVGNDRDQVAITLSAGRGFERTTREALPSPELGKVPFGTARAPVADRAAPLPPGRTEPPRRVPRPPLQ